MVAFTQNVIGTKWPSMFSAWCPINKLLKQRE